MRAEIIAAVVAELKGGSDVNVYSATGFLRYDVSDGPIIVVDIPSDEASEGDGALARGSSVRVDATLTVSVAYSATQTRATVEALLARAHHKLMKNATLGGLVDNVAYAGYDLTPPDEDGDAAVATHTYLVNHRLKRRV